MSLLRSSLVVGLAAALSRVLGFARDLLLAQALGAGPVADAFLAAFRLPNLIRRVLSEGGLNPALVPALARLPAPEAPHFAGEALAAVGLVLTVLIAAVELTAGLAVLLLAPGLADDPEGLALAALYTRLGFPLVAGVTLTSLVAAVLNHGRRYVATALAPLVVNAALIGALLVLERSALPAGEQAAWLAGTASLAGFAQLALVSLALKGPDRPIRLAWPRWTTRLRKLLGAVALTILASSALPLFVLVGTQAASFTPSLMSWLYYADRLMQLPFGIVASVIGVVLLPELARHEAAGDSGALVAAQNRALGMGFLVCAPAATGLAMLAGPIVAVLFERGAFGAADTQGTARVLQGLCVGLPFAVLGKVLAQTLSARGAFLVQLWAVAAGVLVTGLSALWLAGRDGALGIGLSVSTGCLAYAAGLLLAVRRAGLWRPDRSLRRRGLRIALAAGVLAAALAGALASDPPVNVATLAGLCAGGALLFGAAATALGALTREDLSVLTKKS